MASPNPIQQISEDTHTLQSRVNALQENVRLTRMRDSVEDLQSKVHGMAQRITGLRTRGYVFGKDLEDQARAHFTGWTQLYPNVQAQIALQSSSLTNALRPIEIQIPQLVALNANPTAARALLASLRSAVDQMESKVTAAGNSIEGMYDQFSRQVESTNRHLDEIEYLLKQLAEASFQLLPTEAGLAAVKSVWYKTGQEQKGDPEGVLFLTDQRVLFEQKEEIATKKVLFVTTGKQKVQGLQFEAPIALVDKVETSKQGMFKNEDHIEIHFASGGPADTAHFHIWQDNDQWQALINRARIKDFDKERDVPLEQAALDRVKAAPSQCPACGGNITTTVLRGMDSLKCEYCGFVIRL